MLIVGRLLTGLSCGVATGVAPVYLSEIAPLSLRGAIGTVHQLVIVSSVLLSQVLGLPQIFGTSTLWPYLFGVPLLACALQLALLPFCPETPQYLYTSHTVPSPGRELVASGGDEYEPGPAAAELALRGPGADIMGEMAELQSQTESAVTSLGVCGLLGDTYWLRPLLIALMMQLCQQLSGINAVLYYSAGVFTSLGFSPEAALHATLIITCVLCLTTLVSVFLVEIAGRRVLHLVGLGGMAVMGALLTGGFAAQSTWSGAGYLDIIATSGFVMAFAIGPGSIPWFITAEMFPAAARSAAMSLAVLVNWTANFAVAQTFPFMQVHMGKWVFVPFVLLCTLFFVFTYLVVPETRGKSPEDLQAEIHARRGYQSFSEPQDSEPR